MGLQRRSRMALSDEKIQVLAKKAESCRGAAFQEGTGLKQLQEALQCYDQIIESLPDHPYYFRKRASVIKRTGSRAAAARDRQLDEETIISEQIKD